MNSMPAASSARRIARSLAAVMDVRASASAARRMVATPTAEASASSSARQRRSARAARIWLDRRAGETAGLDGMGLDGVDHMIYYISHDPDGSYPLFRLFWRPYADPAVDN